MSKIPLVNMSDAVALIARVAVNHIRREVVAAQQTTSGALRLCMFGLEPQHVEQIVLETLKDESLNNLLDVRIPSNYEIDNNMLREIGVITSESSSHWRNRPLSQNEKVGILFAVTNDEHQKIGLTLGTVKKIETDKLRSLHEDWISVAESMFNSGFNDEEKECLKMLLGAINKMGNAPRIDLLANYILNVARASSEGVQLLSALDEALCFLQLPKKSGQFNQISHSGRMNPAKWKEKFSNLSDNIRPYLFLENMKGERIDEIARTNFDKLCKKGDLNETEQEIIKDFLKADLNLSWGNWIAIQERLVELDWQRIRYVFEGVIDVSQTLGEATIEFFDNNYPEDLTDGEKEFLRGDLSPPPRGRDPFARAFDFFNKYKERLQNDKKLFARWEKYLFRSPKIYSDFLVGVISTLKYLRNWTTTSIGSPPKFLVTVERGEQKLFWEKKNTRLMRFFAHRYHGIERLFQDDENISFDFGHLTRYFFSDPFAESDIDRVDSESKEARQLKFKMSLKSDDSSEEMIFFWEAPASAIPISMADDLWTVASADESFAKICTSNVSVQTVSSKGHMQSISLKDSNTIQDVSGGDKGALVARDLKDGNTRIDIEDELKTLKNIDVISDDALEKIRRHMAEFSRVYTDAIRNWLSPDGWGMSGDSMIEQAECYGNLLDSVLKETKNERSRKALLSPLLRIGISRVEGETPLAIITPWHPLRMAELCIKARQFKEAISKVLNSPLEHVFHADRYYDEVVDQLERTYYPEVCFGIDNNQQSEMLEIGESFLGYSLAIPPILKPTDGVLSEASRSNSGDVARCFSDISEKYLSLLPHEKSNFSAVLYNADIHVPKAIADLLASRVEDESGLQCDLLLTHTDAIKMRQQYEQQNISLSDENSSRLSSETALNFLSRLRVGVANLSNMHTGDDPVRQYDIVLLQDVVSDYGKIKWKDSPSTRDYDLVNHVPVHWSKRKAIDPGDVSVTVYITYPAQPRPCQSYLNSLYHFLEGTTSDDDMIPAREIDYSNARIKELFAQTHGIGDWVINYDSLVDKRFLEREGIRTIRNVSHKSHGRNIVVSTTTKPIVLRRLLSQEIQKINTLTKDEMHDLAEKILDDASKLSGYVVMKAARFGQHAKELIGLVLSMKRIKSLLNPSDHIGWYFLDDYMSIFHQKEEQIADIMSISPTLDEHGNPVLAVIVAESKYVSSADYVNHKKTSKQQLVDTIRRLSHALKPESQSRIDRRYWLKSIANLMLENMENFGSSLVSGLNLEQWAERVRSEEIPIKILGLSHIFVTDEENSISNAGASMPLSDDSSDHCHCFQIVFDQSMIREMFDKCARGELLKEESLDEYRNWRNDALFSIPKHDSQTVPRAGTVEPAMPNSPSPSRPEASREEKDDDKLFSQTSQITHLEKTEKIKETISVSRDISATTFQDWINVPHVDDHRKLELDELVESSAKKLQNALRGYGMTASIVDKRLTPNAVLVKFKGANDLTVTKVGKKRQELLTTHGIDVISVDAAPGEILLMIRRPEREILSLRSVWKERMSSILEKPTENTSLLIGIRENDGGLQYLNIENPFNGYATHGPHTLIAGETGGGKGVLVQTLLLDICATNSPTAAEILMIDPKAGVDYSWLKKMPHLRGGNLITKQPEAKKTITRLVKEMEERYELLHSMGVNNLSAYNKKVGDEKKLSRIWLFHEELADWMLLDDYREAIEESVSRLGVKSRAAGIYLVMVAQRPDNQVFPMQLRANLANRLILRMADERNSRLVLDSTGAENLLGKGHMIAKLSGEDSLICIQVPYINEEEIEEAADFIAKMWS